MRPIARIIAGIDFSSAAEQAVRRGALIAKQLNADQLIALVHTAFN